MTAPTPSRENNYLIAIDQIANREFFQSVFASIAHRLNALELTGADYEAAIDLITTQALSIVTSSITDEVEAQRDNLAAIQEAADTFIAEVTEIQESGLRAGNIRLNPIEGLTADDLQEALAAIIASIATKAPAIATTNAINGVSERTALLEDLGYQLALQAHYGG